MGYLPKHVKRHREHVRLRIIAKAVLAGFVSVKMRRGHMWPDGTPPYGRTTYVVHWPDGKEGHFYDRTTPALMYLFMMHIGPDWVEAFERARNRGLDGQP